MSKQSLLPILFLAFLTACAPGFESYPRQVVDGNIISKMPTDSPTTTTQATDLTFCSALSFEGIAWNESLTPTARRSLAIALSISGSFEGGAGWANITNNFDGMGLSAGLLNQTLGTGSLQPLLAEMDSDHETRFASAFSRAHLDSITGMIDTWKKSSGWKPQSLNLMSVDPEEVESRTTEIESPSAELRLQAVTPASQSVTWARKNLYLSGGDFVAAWKKELQILLARPEYVSLQIEAARRYHAKALEYLHRVGISDLRTYLLMFDIITQNGGIKETRFVEWEKKVKAQKLTTVPAKLKALVDIRLLDTKPEWRADVKSRKYTLIDGTGVVHGKSLNLPKSHCYGSADPVQ
jgi:hypothetical protein